MKKLLLLPLLGLLCGLPLLVNENVKEVKATEDTPILANGKYFIATSDYVYGMNPTESASYPTLVAQASVTAPFTFTHIENNKYEISVGLLKLYNNSNTGSGNLNLRFNSTYGSYNTEWNVSYNSLTDTYNLSIINGGNTANLFANTSDNYWGCNKSATCSDLKLIPVTDFYNNFNTNVTCDNGVTPPSTSKWGDTKTYLNNHPYKDAFYNYLKTASDDTLSKYDYIIAKYGESKYENYLDRAITPLKGRDNIFLTNKENNINNVVTIIVIGVVAISALSIVAIYKKKQK